MYKMSTGCGMDVVRNADGRTRCGNIERNDIAIDDFGRAHCSAHPGTEASGAWGEG